MLKRIVIEYWSRVVISTEPVYGFISQFAVYVIKKKITAVTVTFEIKRYLSPNIEMSTYFKVGALS